MVDSINFGKRLKAAREAKGLKQKELAEQIPVAPQLLSAYEKGSKLPTLERIVEIANCLGTSIDSLIGRDTADDYTLGDAARIMLCLHALGYADIIVSDNPDGTKPHTSLSIWNNEGLQNYLIGYQKMSKLLREKLIDDDIFNQWNNSCLSKLDKETITPQGLDDIDVEGELPF